MFKIHFSFSLIIFINDIKLFLFIINERRKDDNKSKINENYL